MKAIIDADQVLKELNGKDMIDQNEESKGEPFTLGRAISIMVVRPPSSPHGRDGMDPQKKWELARKFRIGGVVELDSADLKQLKDMIKMDPYSPIITGQVLELLDNSGAKQEPVPEEK